MDSAQILTIFKSLLRNKNTSVYTKPLPSKLLRNKKDTRPQSASIEDAFFGDSGKGRITVEFNEILSKTNKLYSLRYNGGANAGHECYIDGKQIVTHQLPIAVVNAKATAIMGRGMVIHPEDLVTEIGQVERQFGGKLPGNLVIDERTTLSLDTHRALETVLNVCTSGGRGSTGRGIATSYASFYERIAVTIKDLLDPNWKSTFSHHYELYQKLVLGFEKKLHLASIPVTRLDREKKGISVGSEKEFISRLSATRALLSEYARKDVYEMLYKAWNNQKVAFTFEGAQGAGLDPYHGVYPDVTASRPMSRHINDSTYNIVLPESIALRVAVMKTTYMSSVGQRKLPTRKTELDEKWIQEAFDEKGRSTGRLRDIYEVSIPIGHYLKRASGYDFLVATHIDASKDQCLVKIVTHYIDKKTRKEKPYFPYQDYLNTLEPHVIEFPGWNGEKVKHKTSAKDLPYNARLYLAFLSNTIAPVVFGTTSPDLGDYISWTEEFK